MTDAITAADVEAARARTPHAFAPPLVVQRRRLLARWSIGLLFLWCLIDFEFLRIVLFSRDWAFEPWRTFYEFDRREDIWVFNPLLPIDRVLTGLGKLGDVFSFMFPPALFMGPRVWGDIFEGLGETLAMAFLGTLLGALFAFPLGWLGAKNILPFTLPRLTIRRGFDFVRAFETLILAMIFIRAFGLGPLAGILAIAISEIGTFAKLFAEAIENTSERPVEGVKASGGSALQRIRYAIMPQVNPVILSVILYNFESNVRSGTILGIVGAGGIGFLLSDRIRAYRWDEAWTIIFLIIAMVYVIDWLSGLVRTRLIGKWEMTR